ncbi:MAG: hypothetical protein AB7T06_39465 [Kofleriaceae bacterium]
MSTARGREDPEITIDQLRTMFLPRLFVLGEGGITFQQVVSVAIIAHLASLTSFEG